MTFSFSAAEHEAFMDFAIREAEAARGKTGDNPWVGCAIVSSAGELVSVGHTQGPGEDHAEIVAMHVARAAGVALDDVVLYSTLEPCAFHGRTPACAHAIVTAGVRRVVTGILDPNPRVDGEGLRILGRAGVEVVSDVRADRIRAQLAPWIFRYHPHEPARVHEALVARLGDRPAALDALARHYGVDVEVAASVVGGR
ncbi:MAG: bifunctional diaminohydroxyphosphoribosylaminopyrimidine deaminase/5-amino-6-(5-phosphoribosylamino)uracil reductase RibD [Polyangiaceae bacterium]